MIHHQHHFSRSHCPVEQLEWFANGTLSAEEQAAVAAHLMECAACRTEVAAWSELRQTMHRVSAHTPEVRADLFAQIERQLDELTSPVPEKRLHTLLATCRPVLLACIDHVQAQARLIRHDLFWLPLLLLPLIGWMVTQPRSFPQVPGIAALLAALLTAFGFAFLYGQEVDPARELTLVTPTSPRLVLGVRFCLVFGYDLLLNCGLILPFLLWKGLATPSWFLGNWLAPLCCLSAIALLLSVLVNARTAVGVCTLLWSIRLLDSLHILQDVAWQQVYERFWRQGPLLFGIALMALLLAFMVLERKERFAPWHR